MAIAARKTHPLLTLLVGDFTPPEFQPVAEQLGHLTEIETAVDCNAAQSRIRADSILPDVIVVAHLWPGQHPHEHLDQLQRSAPLARILALGSSWCEGEPRTGLPWPGMLRTYWHCWLAHWKRDFLRFSDSQLPTWGLPTTATDDERTLFCHPREVSSGKFLAVRSQCDDLADMLCTVCRRWGFGAVWLDPRCPPRIEGPAAILWEGNPTRLHDLRTVRQMYPETPVLALIDFPRWEDVRQVELLGPATVLSKPLNLDDLFSRLEDLLSDRPTEQVQRPRGVA